MKLTRSRLKQTIKEELENVLKERDWSETPGIVGRGIAGLARKGLSRLLPAAQNAIALYKQYKDQPRQIAQSQEMQEWLPLIFGYPGFEEAADVANNAPSAEEIEAQKSEIKAQQSDTDRSRQEHGKPRYKENVAKLNAMKEKLSAAIEERNATRKQINDIVVAAYSEYPGLEKFLVKATMRGRPKAARDFATGAALSLAKGDATGGEYYENKNMKLTKSQLKQIIKENLLKEASLEDKVSDNEHYITKIRLAISSLWSFYKGVNEDVNNLRLDLSDIKTTIGIKKSRFAEEPDVVPGPAKPTTDTNPGGRPVEGKNTLHEQVAEEELKKSKLKQIVKKELEKILNEVQRLGVQSLRSRPFPADTEQTEKEKAMAAVEGYEDWGPPLTWTKEQMKAWLAIAPYLEPGIKEELKKILSERGFGEGEPAKDELSKKREVYLEEEDEEGIKEKKLTKPEKKEKEKIVKGMKKKKSDFEKRYPGRGEEVMYATATKMAKKRK